MRIVLILGLFICAQLCTGAASGIRELYLQQDFSQAVQGSTKLALDRSSTFQLIFPENVKVSSLTETELRLISNFEYGSGDIFGLGRSARYIPIYFDTFGEMPRDGFDMLGLFNADKQSLSAYKSLEVLPPAEVLSKIALSLNPATGRLYDSFEIGQDRQLGFGMELIGGDEGLMQIPMPLDKGNSATNIQQYRKWRVVVYGEEKGRVIAENTLLVQVTDGCCQP